MAYPQLFNLLIINNIPTPIQLSSGLSGKGDEP